MRLGNICTPLSDKITLLTIMGLLSVGQVSAPTSWPPRRARSFSNMSNQDHGGPCTRILQTLDTSHQDPLLEQEQEEDNQDVWSPARHRHDGEAAIIHLKH